jgi:sec-independent protein translocase protein TatB
VFGIGWTEFILIAVVLLIIVGPKHLPAVFRKLGRITAEFRSASRELRNQIEIEADDLESPGKVVRDLERDMVDAVTSPYAELAEEQRKLRKDAEEATRLDEPASSAAKPGSDAAEPAPKPGERATEEEGEG